MEKALLKNINSPDQNGKEHGLYIYATPNYFKELQTDFEIKNKFALDKAKKLIEKEWNHLPKLDIVKQEFYIYILELEQNKFYVGKTNDLALRLKFHILKRNCSWTNLYPLVKLIDVYKTNDVFEEDKSVKKYMMLKGVENVRGGAYSNFNLNKYQKIFILKEFCHLLGKCYYCLQTSHFVRVNFFLLFFLLL